MQISRSKLIEEAKATGFQPLMQEKVILLVTLLNKFNAGRYLSDRIVLKGGTALNLFVFRLPRLSVDIDLNYIGAADRETMLKERPLIEKQILAICQQEGFKIKHEPSEHVGGKYLLGYQSAMG
jgi:predicted nucleotidyltransferase component of viral defense system